MPKTGGCRLSGSYTPRARQKNNKFRILFETWLLGKSSLSVPPTPMLGKYAWGHG